jgi:cation diffusion facilitator family transporter
MHIHNLEKWQHSHDFSVNQEQAEKNTKIVMLLTAVTMVAEIVAGTIFGSMALLADGWHMATHVTAFGIAVFAYQYARSHATDPKYTFGTGKVSVLGGFASAVALAVVSLIMVLESGFRLFQPQGIQFNEAISVAIIGLVVNLVSAWLLQDHHDHHEHHHDHDHHEHHHDHDRHEHHHEHHDHNLRAAYLHVLADALTSVFAIVALFAGKFLGWVWMDAVMGLIGGGVIAKWSYNLVCDTGLILLDGSIDKHIKLDIVTAIEENADRRVTDLHIWHIGQNHLAVTISLVTDDPQTPEYYKSLLAHIPSLSHVIVEVNHCHDEANVAENLRCEV